MMEILGLGLGMMFLFPIFIYIISLIVVLKAIFHIAEGEKSTLDWFLIIFGCIFAFIPGTNVAIAIGILCIWLINKAQKLNTIGE